VSVGVVVLALVLWWLLKPAPPRFEGRTAEEWFDHGLERSMNIESTCQALAAMGEDAVPVLVDVLLKENGRTDSSWLKFYGTLPAWLRQRISVPVAPRKRSEFALMVLDDLPPQRRQQVLAAVFDHLAALARNPATPNRVAFLQTFLLEPDYSTETLGPLMAALLEDGDALIRQTAINTIIARGHPRDERGDHFASAVAKLTWFLQIGGTNYPSALAALAAIGPAARSAVPTIESLASEPGQFEACAYALWWIDRQTNRVFQLATDARTTDLRALAVIGDLGDAARPLLPHLGEAITHPRIDIAFHSVLAIARIAPEQPALVNDTLLAWVKHRSTPLEYVRLSIEQLAARNVTSAEALDAIRQRLHSRDREVREASRRALAQLAERAHDL